MAVGRVLAREIVLLTFRTSRRATFLEGLAEFSAWFALILEINSVLVVEHGVVFPQESARLALAASDLLVPVLGYLLATCAPRDHCLTVSDLPAPPIVLRSPQLFLDILSLHFGFDNDSFAVVSLDTSDEFWFRLVVRTRHVERSLPGQDGIPADEATILILRR